jgi:hypothetical protein
MLEHAFEIAAFPGGTLGRHGWLVTCRAASGRKKASHRYVEIMVVRATAPGGA